MMKTSADLTAPEEGDPLEHCPFCKEKFDYISELEMEYQELEVSLYFVGSAGLAVIAVILLRYDYSPGAIDLGVGLIVLVSGFILYRLRARRPFTTAFNKEMGRK